MQSIQGLQGASCPRARFWPGATSTCATARLAFLFSRPQAEVGTLRCAVLDHEYVLCDLVGQMVLAVRMKCIHIAQSTCFFFFFFAVNHAITQKHELGFRIPFFGLGTA